MPYIEMPRSSHQRLTFLMPSSVAPAASGKYLLWATSTAVTPSLCRSSAISGSSSFSQAMFDIEIRMITPESSPALSCSIP